MSVVSYNDDNRNPYEIQSAIQEVENQTYRLGDNDAKEDAIDAVADAVDIQIRYKSGMIGAGEASSRLHDCAERIRRNDGVLVSVLRANMSKTGVAVGLVSSSVTGLIIHSYYVSFCAVMASLSSTMLSAETIGMELIAKSANLDVGILNAMKQSMGDASILSFLNPFNKNTPKFLDKDQAIQTFKDEYRTLITSGKEAGKEFMLDKISDGFKSAASSAISSGKSGIASVLTGGMEMIGYQDAATGVATIAAAASNIAGTTMYENTVGALSNLGGSALGFLGSVGGKAIEMFVPSIDPSSHAREIEHKVDQLVDKAAATFGQNYADIVHYTQKGHKLANNGINIILMVLVALIIMLMIQIGVKKFRPRNSGLLFGKPRKSTKKSVRKAKKSARKSVRKSAKKAKKSAKKTKKSARKSAKKTKKSVRKAKK